MCHVWQRLFGQGVSTVQALSVGLFTSLFHRTAAILALKLAPKELLIFTVGSDAAGLNLQSLGDSLILRTSA